MAICTQRPPQSEASSQPARCASQHAARQQANKQTSIGMPTKHTSALGRCAGSLVSARATKSAAPADSVLPGPLARTRAPASGAAGNARILSSVSESLCCGYSGAVCATQKTCHGVVDEGDVGMNAEAMRTQGSGMQCVMVLVLTHGPVGRRGLRGRRIKGRTALALC